MGFLGLAWRRWRHQERRPGPWRQSLPSKDRGSPAPLIVTATTSRDSATDSETSSPRESLPETPRTPEGLRPRKALEVIRAELHLPDDVLEHLSKYQRMLNIPSSSLAPQPISPKISNSSFYSRSSTSMIAESPDLAVAKTAVGALVGKNEARLNNKKRILPPMPGETQASAMGVLPPRDLWLSRLGHHHEPTTTAEGIYADRIDEEDDEESNESDNQAYQQLNDSQEGGADYQQRTMLRNSSPVSTDASSVRGGSEVMSWQRQQADWQQHHIHQEHRHVSFGDEASYSSQQGLVEDLPARYVYNFDPIQAEDGSVSAMSQSTHPAMSHNDSIHSLDSVRDSHAPTPERYGRIAYQQQRACYNENVMENALLQRKAQKQKHAREQLLLGIAQRLHHDMELVQEVEALRGSDETGFARTPLNQEGLVVGYSNDKRERLTKYLDAILSEMDVAVPEDFFLSPSQMEGIGDTHNDLREAMSFVLRLVHQAFPRDEYQPLPTWKCKSSIRNAMGLQSIPESPETIRGGDTSMFSLPSECSTTPHTSNRSIATTITSKPSPYREPSSPPNKAIHEAAHDIRYTIEVITTLLQRMTVACNTLLAEKCSAEETILATEAIKRNYLQLIMIPTLDLQHVLDAFVVQGTEEEPILARKVSEDEEHHQKASSIPPRLIQSTVRTSSKPFLSKYEEESGSTANKNDMFSPTTDDMKSTSVRIEEDNESDNLRRQVESNNYEEDQTEREGPAGSSPGSNSSDGMAACGRILNKLAETGGYHEYMCEAEPKLTPLKKSQKLGNHRKGS